MGTACGYVSLSHDAPVSPLSWPPPQPYVDRPIGIQEEDCWREGGREGGREGKGEREGGRDRGRVRGGGSRREECTVRRRKERGCEIMYCSTKSYSTI